MPVKAVIVYKWSRNAADALVRADGSIDWRNAKMAAGEDDPAALAAATQLVAGSGGELVGLTIGDGDASWALARGVESTWSVTDVPPLADNARTAAVLAAAVRRIGDVDVVVIGDSRQEPGVAAALAGELGWPALVGLQSATCVDGRVQVTRRVGDQRQTVVVPTPVVLGVAAEADVDRVPGMKELLAARKRPVNRITLADLGTDAGDVSTLGCRKPESAPARVFDGDPTQAAAQLVAALRAEGVL
jgi:electron transfer flavoprotein beta subunit